MSPKNPPGDSNCPRAGGVPTTLAPTAASTFRAIMSACCRNVLLVAWLATVGCSLPNQSSSLSGTAVGTGTQGGSSRAETQRIGNPYLKMGRIASLQGNVGVLTDAGEQSAFAQQLLELSRGAFSLDPHFRGYARDGSSLGWVLQHGGRVLFEEGRREHYGHAIIADPERRRFLYADGTPLSKESPGRAIAPLELSDRCGLAFEKLETPTFELLPGAESSSLVPFLMRFAPDTIHLSPFHRAYGPSGVPAGELILEDGRLVARRSPANAVSVAVGEPGSAILRDVAVVRSQFVTVKDVTDAFRGRGFDGAERVTVERFEAEVRVSGIDRPTDAVLALAIRALRRFGILDAEPGVEYYRFRNGQVVRLQFLKKEFDEMAVQ